MARMKVDTSQSKRYFNINIPADFKPTFFALCVAERRSAGQMVMWLVEREIARRAALKSEPVK